MARTQSQLAAAKARQAKNTAKKAGSASYGASVATKASKASTPSFNFDAAAPTKAYTDQANAIYDPQIQAAKNQQGYNQTLAEQQKVTTRKQFQDLLTKTIESINNRGAFFGGGALNQENQVNTEQTNALTGIDQATNQANLGLSSDIAQLGGKKSEYISSGVNSAQSSAYNQFQDSLQNYFKQQSLDTQAKQDALQQSNADRTYALAAKNANKTPASSIPKLQSVSRKVGSTRTGQTTEFGTYNPQSGEYKWQGY